VRGREAPSSHRKDHPADDQEGAADRYDRAEDADTRERERHEAAAEDQAAEQEADSSGQSRSRRVRWRAPGSHDTGHHRRERVDERVAGGRLPVAGLPGRIEHGAEGVGPEGARRDGDPAEQ
jgi:hypothetical protein